MEVLMKPPPRPSEILDRDIWDIIPASTADRIRTKCESIASMLIEKNRAYGDSALAPARIFSSASPIEAINVRIDDKLSRLQRGTEYPGDDTILDLTGYLILLLIARDKAGK
jgi:hypothetical protein